jgi:predicted phosphodiesterase
VNVAFTSDLHIDHHPEVIDHITRQAVAARVEVLILAGDVCSGVDTLRQVLGHFRAHLPRVVYVPGNHDLWTQEGTPDSRARYLEVFPDLCAAARVDYLPDGPVVLPGLSLVGQTGWYDYSLRDPALDAEVPLAAYERGSFGPLAWSDRRFMTWPDVDDRALTAFMAARLRADLAATPRDRPAWVVTHMLPFAELVARKPLPWGFVGGFLGAAVLGEEILRAVAEGLDVRRAIAGHTHFRREARIGPFIAETSPIGYPREILMGGAPSLEAHVRQRLRVIAA